MDAEYGMLNAECGESAIRENLETTISTNVAKATDAQRLRMAQSIFTKAGVRAGKIVAIEPRPAMYPLLEIAGRADGKSLTGGSDGRRTRGGNSTLFIIMAIGVSNSYLDSLLETISTSRRCPS